MSSCFRVNPPAWITILFWLLCNPILILIVYWCRRRQVFKCEFWRSVNWQNPYMLSYEFVPFGSVLQEKIENDCDTILDKTCWHMLKKGTFPPKFLNKSTLLWNKVSVAPLPPPNNVATNVFHIQRKIWMTVSSTRDSKSTLSGGKGVCVNSFV